MGIRAKLSGAWIAPFVMSLAAGSTSATASEPQTGVYIGLGAGLSHQSSTDVDGPGTSAHADYNIGFAGIGSIGYALQNGLRVEMEGSLRQNGLNSLDASGAITPGTEFDRTNPAIMLNIAYDFHRDWPVIPTIGAGVGAAFTTADDLGDRTKFAYQAIAGLGYQLTDWVTAFADYRFFGTPEIDGRAANRTLSFNNFNHSVVVGLRFKLFDPLTDRGLATDEPTGLRPIAGPVVEKEVRAAKEAAESPIATMPTSYLVFFEVNDTALSGEADATVLTAAESLRRGQHSKAVLTGHTDSAGSAAYNERLARQRAQSVKNRLIELGVSPEQIELRVQGEAEPLVPASGNRPEPRNRRVEINLI